MTGLGQKKTMQRDGNRSDEEKSEVFVDQLAHTFRRSFANDGDPIAQPGIDRLGVDEIDGCLFRNETYQSGSRIDGKRGADDDEDVCLPTPFGRFGDARNGLTEEHDERPEKRTVARQLALLHFDTVGGEGAYVTFVIDIAARTHLHQFTMQVYHVGGAGTLVKVINILRNNINLIATLFEL